MITRDDTVVPYAGAGSPNTPDSSGVRVTTPMVNLLADPNDLTTGWTIEGAVVTSSDITFGGSQRVFDAWYTLTPGNRILFVFRSNAGSPPAGLVSFYNEFMLRYFREGGLGYIPDDQSGTTTRSFRTIDDGIFRNYAAQYTATPERALFNIESTSNNAPGTVVTYEMAGMYDIEGMTGVIYDPARQDVRYDLDTAVVWWGDSIPAKQVWHLGDWLNVLNADDEAVGGETSTEILTRFNAAPGKHVFPTLILMGHNNLLDLDGPLTIQSDITSMTDQLDALGTDYRVLTMTSDSSWTIGTQAYDDREAVAAWILSNYGSRAIDLYTYLRTKGDGGVDDNSDIAQGVIPRSILGDSIHLNGFGHDYMRQVVYASVNVPGWRG